MEKEAQASELRAKSKTFTNFATITSVVELCLKIQNFHQPTLLYSTARDQTGIMNGKGLGYVNSNLQSKL